jgi:integrase
MQVRVRHIREYQAHLFQKRKLSSGSVTNRLAALRFFYIKTLKKAWSIAETPYPKKTHRLPPILREEEVARLIDAAGTPFHRTLLMTLYATGLRRAEVTHLKVNDIDSKRMVIHVRAGKGRKDRDVMLSPKLLEELRQHWLRLRRKTSDWLFPGNRWHTATYPIDAKTLYHACQETEWRPLQQHRHGVPSQERHGSRCAFEILLGSNAKAKKCRHRAREGNMSLDIPFNRTIRICDFRYSLPTPNSRRWTWHTFRLCRCQSDPSMRPADHLTGQGGSLPLAVAVKISS